MLTFREIVDRHELEKFMRLRYQSYANSSMHSFLQVNEYMIDIDVYDLHSKHYGLFYDYKPVGFVRIIVPKDEVYNDEVYSIGEKYGFFTPNRHGHSAFLKSDYPELPFISYLEVPNSVKMFYSQLKQKKSRLVEGSRLFLVDDKKGLVKAKFLIECTIVLCVLVYEGKNYAMINCDEGHKKFYGKYGFETINENERYYLNGRIENPSCLLSLSLSLSAIPTTFHKKLKLMAAEFKETNQISRRA